MTRNTRRTSDPEFLRNQHAHLYDPHVAPFNDLVDDMNRHSTRGWVPHIAPMFGGVSARVLSIFEAPGKGTLEPPIGSGMLCTQNNDGSADLHATLLAHARIPVAELLPWNSYPWYIGRRKPTAGELDAAAPELDRLIALAPALRIVILHGEYAKDGWRRYASRYPVTAGRLTKFETWHTSILATNGAPTPEARAERCADRFSTYSDVAELLRAG